MLLVHVGLGKCATTTLQRRVFPGLKDIDPEITYGETKIRRLCVKNQLFGTSDAEKQIIRRYLDDHPKLVISHEALCKLGRHLEIYAERNLALFGADARILITVRDPISLISSKYAQLIHDGDIYYPEEIIINSELSSRISRFIPEHQNKYIDVDTINYEELHNTYQKRFKNVYMVPVEKLYNLRFIQDCFDLSDDGMESLRRVFRTAPRENVSYSSLAMRLTFARERLLRGFGLKTIGADDIRPHLMYARYFSDEENWEFGRRWVSSGWKLRRGKLWRRLMQNYVNRYLPYEKFKLDLDWIHENKMVRRNMAYYEQLVRSFE